MNNKLIVIEGTDCSGKSTQISMLILRLRKLGIKIKSFKFPNYDSPTGEIVGKYYLGKNGQGLFKEGATHVDSKVASLYFSADRLYNISKVRNLLKSSNVLLDRYVDSNMAYSGGKFTDKELRNDIYKFCKKLEYGLLKLPKPDIKILLYMPIKFIKILRNERKEDINQHNVKNSQRESIQEKMSLQIDEYDKDNVFLGRVNKSYLEVAKLMKYKVINCTKGGKLRDVKDINDELFEYIQSKIR